ncbi:MAG: dTMP kinase [Anaerolineae bacterium]
MITLEGPEGGGKTTQAARLAEELRSEGREVVSVREPGGTATGERIREILLAPEAAMVPQTEALLFCAARAELIAQVVRPALHRAALVLCDRFYDATLAYQGHGWGVPLDELAAVIHFATGGLRPDLTILLDLPVDTGLARRRQHPASWNRLDGAGSDFHRRVRAGYLDLARREPDRWCVIDAGAGPDEVAAAVAAAVKRALGPAGQPRG